MTDETQQVQLARVATAEVEHFAVKREITGFEVIVFARVEAGAAIAVASDTPSDPVDQLLALLMYAKQHADAHGLPFSFDQGPSS